MRPFKRAQKSTPHELTGKPESGANATTAQAKSTTPTTAKNATTPFASAEGAEMATKGGTTVPTGWRS